MNVSRQFTTSANSLLWSRNPVVANGFSPDPLLGCYVQPRMMQLKYNARVLARHFNDGSRLTIQKGTQVRLLTTTPSDHIVLVTDSLIGGIGSVFAIVLIPATGGSPFTTGSNGGPLTGSGGGSMGNPPG